ncbi:beta-ketoacyl synthase N-terminal-like domain-containing protein, partial [Amycolatopsis mediterranei]
MTRTAVITGIGVVAPGGIGTKAFWALLTEGRTATRPISAFDASRFRSRIAAECDFEGELNGLTAEESGRLDRAAQFALVCADEAVVDGGLDPGALDPYRLGVTIGSAVGATIGLENEYLTVSAGARDWVVDPAKAA